MIFLSALFQALKYRPELSHCSELLGTIDWLLFVPGLIFLLSSHAMNNAGIIKQCVIGPVLILVSHFYTKVIVSGFFFLF